MAAKTVIEKRNTVANSATRSIVSPCRVSRPNRSLDQAGTSSTSSSARRVSKKKNKKFFPGLPFVDSDSFWWVEPRADFEKGFAHGQSWAAAYLKLIKSDPNTAPLLASIVTHMRRADSPDHAAGFFDVIDQHLRASITSPDVEMLFQY